MILGHRTLLVLKITGVRIAENNWHDIFSLSDVLYLIFKIKNVNVR